MLLLGDASEPLHDQDTGPDGGAPAMWAFGVCFSQVDVDAVARLIAARDPAAPFAYVATPNAVHVVNIARGEPRFVAGVDGAWVRTCDSRIVRALARSLAGRPLALALGSDLTAHLFHSVIQPDDGVTIIGGDTALADALRMRFGLRRLALHAPPYGFITSEVEIERCVRFIQDNPARYVFIACGAPQAELLADRVRRTPGCTGVGLCVGASLLFVTGRLRRAPLVVQRAGLEWLHRLIVEPRRMLPRLVNHQLPMIGVALRYALDSRLRATHRRAAP